MIKKLTAFFITVLYYSLPVFWLKVTLPSSRPGDDYNIQKTNIVGNEDTLFSGVNLVNKYLRRSFAVVCTAMVIYGGYHLITANGDKKAMKKAQRALIGTGVGIVIAMLSYTVVRILTDLF